MQEQTAVNGIYDCHVHLPMKSADPISQLLREMDENNVKGFVLFLNSAKEEELYLDNIRHFDGRNYKVALLLDIHSENCLENFKRLEKRGIEYDIKIHPRISNITKSDFALVKKKLEELCYHTIIVDYWIFGYQLDNHIGLELSIYLANELPDKIIVLAHSGGCKLVETMLLTRPLKNIYYDLSLTQMYFEHSSIEMDVDYFIKWTWNRILFGSDYPEFKTEEAWKTFGQHFHNAGKDAELSNSVELAQVIYGLE